MPPRSAWHSKRHPPRAPLSPTPPFASDCKGVNTLSNKISTNKLSNKLSTRGSIHYQINYRQIVIDCQATGRGETSSSLSTRGWKREYFKSGAVEICSCHVRAWSRYSRISSSTFTKRDYLCENYYTPLHLRRNPGFKIHTTSLEKEPRV